MRRGYEGGEKPEGDGEQYQQCVSQDERIGRKIYAKKSSLRRDRVPVGYEVHVRVIPTSLHVRVI